ncbi:probable mitotic checkpoint serine/threonine-protein kinase BUB1 at N-terminal half [Coccomyxa sp. Obi]|nr:probable mitotic checkpoint serine/threonine-protein kinase BUB1 at N-terminal half [Coccomyxa sp. Obi]
MDWETSKENFQPLKQGRDPTQIVKKPALTPKKFDSQVEEQRRIFWKEIAEYNGPDPLEVWLRFIKWTQETFKSGGHRAEVLPLLERCTRELQDVPQYKDDVRYLRVWIQYADCLPEPRDVFTYLKEHNIGQDFCVYYVAYAAYLELRGSYAKAEGVFQAGLQRMAHPVDRLRCKYEDFQHRMARRKARKALEGEEGAAAEEDNGQTARVVLNTLRAARPGGPRPTQGGASSNSVQAAAGLSRPKRKGLFAAGSDSENRPSGGLDIFVDDAFRPGGSSAAPPVPETSNGGETGWKHLGTFEQTRKENMQKPGKWAGAKLRQKQSLVMEPVAPLEIHVDEELAQQPAQRMPKPDAAAAAAPSLRLRLDAPDLEEHLQHDPLRLHKGHALETEARRVPHAGGRDRPHSEGPAPKRKREERFAWDADKLVDPSGMELSFEEVRARQWLQQSQRAASQLTSKDDDGDDMDISSPMRAATGAATAEPGQRGTPFPDQQSPAAQHAHLAGASGLQAHSAGEQPAVVERLKAVRTQLAAAAEARDGVRLGRANSGASPPSGGGGSQPRTQPSTPTSAAFVSSRSSSPLAAVQEEVPSDLAAEADEHAAPPNAVPDVTLATQAAFAAVNSMFSETMALPRHRPAAIISPALIASGQAADQRGIMSTNRPTEAAQARLQPMDRGNADITIATRSAFDAVNSMFLGALPHDAPWPGAEAASRPRRGARVSSGGDLTMKLLGTRRPLPSRVGLQRAGAAAEPTVTIGTQAAFDALNDMFRSELPHEGTSATAQRPELLSSGEHSAVSPEQAGAAAATDMDLPIYQDTQFFSNGPQSQGDVSGELAIYEDTQFMRLPTNTPQPLAQQEDAGFATRSATVEQSPAGFQVYEETQFMKENAAGRPVESLELYEDTQFISASQHQAPRSTAGQPAAPVAAHHMAEDVPELGVYEETEFRMGGAERGHSPQEPGGGALDAYEDTALLQGLQPGASAPAARQDVTAFMTENVAPPAGLQLDQDTGDLLADGDAPDIFAEQENEGQADRLLPARDLSDPTAAACVLRDISPERMAALGISIEEDAEALERLHLGGCNDQDEFQAFRLDGSGSAAMGLPAVPDTAASSSLIHTSTDI